MKTGDKKRREKCENIIFSWFLWWMLGTFWVVREDEEINGDLELLKRSSSFCTMG